MKLNDFRLIYFDPEKGEKVISSEQELQSSLIELRTNASTPESINLISPNGDILTIAIGSDFGFVQFESASPDSPYLIAIDKQEKTLKDYREVDAGGTPTPIPENACLPTEKVIEIILYYFNNLKIPNTVDWEEV